MCKCSRGAARKPASLRRRHGSTQANTTSQGTKPNDTVKLKIPKLRQGSYFPKCLEPRRTAEKALAAVIQEAYVQGNRRGVRGVKLVISDSHEGVKAAVAKPSGVIHHSDQGSQPSVAFGQRCELMGLRPSMGSVGDADDNAMAERFFASLDCELLDRRRFKSKLEARLAVFTWIEGWYNLRRRHSAIGYQCPVNFERTHIDVIVHKHPVEHGLPTVGSGIRCATPPVDNPAPRSPRPHQGPSANLST